MNIDKDILRHLQQNNLNGAATSLYKYFPMVLHVIKQKEGSIDDAKDLFQEAVLVLIKKIVEDKEEINCSYGTYLSSICKYQWNNKINKLSNRKTALFTENMGQYIEEDVKDFDEDEEKFKVLNKVLNTIGEKCAKILNLFYIEKWSMDEIAQKMGFSSINSAKTQKYKCIERAKKLALENNMALKA